MTPASTVRVISGPIPVDEIVRELPTDGCGAIVLIATLARGGGLDVTLEPGGKASLERAARAALTGEVQATYLAHAEGRVPSGGSLVVAAAAAVHRADALKAAHALLNSVQGVATRREA